MDNVTIFLFRMAPELIDGYPYSFPVDIWSTGILLMELVHGLPPYYEYDTKKVCFSHVEFFPQWDLNL
jgi:serine/threonine protein kinase